MPADQFASESVKLSDPVNNAAVVVPHDTNPLPATSRGLYVGTGGDVTVVTAGGQTVKFANLAGGILHPIRATHVLATPAPTASGILAVW